jgi:hypothetical protein
MATTIFRRDHLLRKVVDPTGTAKDSTGRLTTSTLDYMGRPLVAKVFAGTTAFTAGEYIEVGGTTVYRVTVSGTTAAGAPTAPGYGLTVVSGGATLRQETTA